MEEFYESDVMWPESHGCSTAASTGSLSHFDMTKRNRRRCPGTSPVRIPAVPRRGQNELQYCEDEALQCRGRAELVPPHVLLSRRRAEGEVAFSLCSGAGRTLKGRDLNDVRNSVLRMTGFIES